MASHTRRKWSKREGRSPSGTNPSNCPSTLTPRVFSFNAWMMTTSLMTTSAKHKLTSMTGAVHHQIRERRSGSSCTTMMWFPLKFWSYTNSSKLTQPLLRRERSNGRLSCPWSFPTLTRMSSVDRRSLIHRQYLLSHIFSNKPLDTVPNQTVATTAQILRLELMARLSWGCFMRHFSKTRTRSVGWILMSSSRMTARVSGRPL